MQKTRGLSKRGSLGSSKSGGGKMNKLSRAATSQQLKFLGPDELPPVRAATADLSSRKSLSEMKASLAKRRFSQNSLTHAWIDSYAPKYDAPLRGTGLPRRGKSVVQVSSPLGMSALERLPARYSLSLSPEHSPPPFLSEIIRPLSSECGKRYHSRLPTSFRVRAPERRRQTAILAMVDAIKTSKRLENNIRRMLMSWQMRGELRSLAMWVSNMTRRKMLLNRITGFKKQDTLRALLHVWFFFRPLRAMARWRKKAKTSRQHATGKQSVQEQKIEREQFAMSFLHAVDTDGDGGLSLCELKAAELGSVKAANSDSRFAKASIWLQNNRNFQKYDTQGIGVIDEPELIKAMEVFLDEHWKYEGVLW